MKTLAASTLALSILAFAGCAQAAPSQNAAETTATLQGTSDRAEIESIIKDYLMQNPELVRDALEELDRREEAAIIQAVRDAVAQETRDMTIGPKNAKVTIVEFFDYNCGFCKRSTTWLNGVIDKHPNDVHVVFKELPILERSTKTSRNAAKAALAAGRQGKYREMHFELMKASGLTKERIDGIAKKVGVDVAKMRKDMADPAMETYLEDTLGLASTIPDLTGTPFFLINDQFFAGADTSRLQAILDEELKG